MSKVKTVQEAMEHIKDGMSVMIGGFLACGTPETLIDALIEKNVKDLTIIANDTGYEDRGIGRLIVNNQVKSVIASHIGTNPETGKRMNEGTMKVELSPQGTLAERIRAHGAGLGGIITPTGLGTVVADGKQTIDINGRTFLVEEPIGADIALVKARKADKLGNLQYEFSGFNFNPLIAMAAKTVIVLAEEIVEVGEIDPNFVHTPHVFVDIIVKGDK